MNSRVDIAAASAEDEALRWLLDFDDLSEVEQTRFLTWLGERPENRLAFESAERDWRRLDVVRQLATAAPDPDVVDKWLWRRRLRRRYVPLAAAAGLAAVAIALLLLPGQHFEANYRTAIGQYEEIRLPDDSVITLNTNSEASVHYSAEERRVHLKSGEGHFVIAPSREWPFVVVAGAGTVRAVGTAFNVYLKDDLVEVTVTEGVVDVVPNAQLSVGNKIDAERLNKGQKLEYRETIKSVSRVDPEETDRKLAWRDGMLDFLDDPLAEVIEEASRYTATKITVEDPGIESLLVTAYLKAGDVDTLLELIDSNETVAVRRIAPGVVQIIRAGNNASNN